jgi:hypothetical protein
VLIGELSILIAGGSDNKLFVFLIETNEKEDNSSGLSLKLNSSNLIK